MNKKDKILFQAIEVFSKKGFENTSIEDLVTECSTSKGTFYYYFKSKNDLLYDIIEKWSYMVTSEIYKKIPQDADAKQKIDKLVDLSVEFVFHNVSICKLIMHQFWNTKDRWKNKYSKLFKKTYHHLLECFLLEIMQNGTKDDQTNVKITATILSNLIFAGTTSWIQYYGKKNKDNYLKNVKHSIHKILFR